MRLRDHVWVISIVVAFIVAVVSIVFALTRGLLDASLREIFGTTAVIVAGLVGFLSWIGIAKPIEELVRKHIGSLVATSLGATAFVLVPAVLGGWLLLWS